MLYFSNKNLIIILSDKKIIKFIESKMTKSISITNIARNFSEYINRVAYRGEHFIVLRGKKPVAELRPVPHGNTLAELPELLAALPKLSPEEAEAFTEDLNAAKKELENQNLRDPWDTY